MTGPDWIAADWGTSNLRIWGIASNGETMFELTSDRGMSRLAPADYPNVLVEMVGAHVTEANTPVVICGMAGARQGWREAPYLPLPARLDELGKTAVRPDMPDARFSPYILPGLCVADQGAEDVMRGEETQLLGLLALDPGFSGTVCLPGTHSKWVTIVDGTVTRFETVVTGELYALLSQHSVLRHALSGPETGPCHEEGLSAGLEHGLSAPERLGSALFRTRAAALVADMPSDWCHGYLSGLLVGAEIASHREWRGSGAVVLIGTERLCRHYGAAIARDGGQSRIVDATTATRAGLAAARTTLPVNG